MSQISIEQLFTKIGVLTIENDLLKQRVAELEASLKDSDTGQVIVPNDGDEEG